MPTKEKLRPRQVSVTFSDHEWDDLNAYLTEQGIVKRTFVRRAVLDYLKHEKAKNS